jgi:putative chitinase
MNLDDLLKSIREESDSKGGKIDSAKFLNTKTFTNPLKGQRYQAPGLPSAPVVVKPTVLKIDPKKIIPENVDVVGEEFGDKIDELIQVIREDNKLEEKSQKEDKRQLEAQKKKGREDRIETKKETKSFLIDLKKSTGKFGGFFDKLKKFLKTVLLGGLINTLYNFLTNPKNKDKIAATQKFLRNYWPAVLGALAYFFTPFGTLVNFVVGTVGKFLVKLGLLVAKNPILAAALGVGVGAEVLRQRSVEATEQIIEREEEKAGKELTPEEQADELSKPFNILETLTRILLPSLNEKVEGRSGGGLSMGTDTVPAMLTPGEFIMSRGAVNMFGADTMMAMNKMGGGTNRPKYGKVLGYSGGGLFGEAPLTKAARAAGYKDKELAAFLAQMAHETGNFQFRRELSGGASHYGGGGPYTLPDGKVVPAKYHGRGYVQLTHDYNYKKYGDRLGIDLLNNPELALDGDIAARIAVEYWKDHVRPTVKGDWDNVFLHSKAINLPSATSPSQVRGMADRQTKYDEYLKKIMSQKPRQIMPTAPGSLGPAFSDDVTMKKQQELNTINNSVRSKLSNPIDTFLIKPFRRVFTPGTPNVPTETRNFVLPSVSSPQQNQSSSQTNDVPTFSVVSGNRMRNLISKDLGIHDLAGVS